VGDTTRNFDIHEQLHAWASEGFFQGGAKGGEFYFSPLEIEKTTF